MDVTDEFPSETFMHYGFRLKLIRVVDRVVMPTEFTVKMEMAVNPDVEDDKEIELAMNKIAYWLDSASRSIAFSAANKDAIGMFLDAETNTNRTDNPIMLLPFDPDDQGMAIILQSKFNALSAGAVLFGATEISADNSHGLSFVYIGDGPSDLPDMNEWVGEHNWFDRPWWNRDDASLLDTMPPDGADLSDMPAWAYSLDFLGEHEEKPKSVIVPGKFKPVVIDGGDK